MRRVGPLRAALAQLVDGAQLLLLQHRGHVPCAGLRRAAQGQGCRVPQGAASPRALRDSGAGVEDPDPELTTLWDLEAAPPSACGALGLPPGATPEVAIVDQAKS